MVCLRLCGIVAYASAAHPEQFALGLVQALETGLGDANQFAEPVPGAPSDLRGCMAAGIRIN